MLLYEIMLLGVCLVYGWILAKIFGRENFQNTWIWTTFTIFFINDMYCRTNLIRHKDEEE